MGRDPHLVLDVGKQMRVIKVAQVFVAIDTLLLGDMNHPMGDLRAHLPHPSQHGINSSIGMLRLCQTLTQRQTSRLDHRIRDVLRLGEKGAQTETGEDVHVVTLAGVVVLALVVVCGEGGTRGEDDLAIGPLNGIVELAFGERDGVGQREDDGTLVMLRLKVSLSEEAA